MEYQRVIGIDPGFSGAIAVIDTAKVGELDYIEVWDMPLHQIKIGKSVKSKIDVAGVVSILAKLERPARCFIEDVGSSPQMGVTSAFNFGFGAGVLHGILAADYFSMRAVTPSKWKRDMRLNSSKDMSRKVASERFPAFAHLWARAKDDGRAEAVLLALWGLLYGQ